MVGSRKGFTLIELIFAIVVIAITVMSLPMVARVTNDSSASNLEVKELVFEAYVQALQTAEDEFTDINSSGSSTVVERTTTDKILGLKQDNTVTITVTGNEVFDPNESNASIKAKTKKIAVTVASARDNTVYTKFYVFDFDINTTR